MTMRRRTSKPDDDTKTPAEDAVAPVPTLSGRLIGAVLAAEDATHAAEGRAERAEAHGVRSDYCVALGERLGATVDAQPTRDTIALVAFPEPDAWAIVDLDTSEGMIRLAIVHPDPAKAPMAELLNTRWAPLADDPIGLPAVLRSGAAIAITDDVDRALVDAAHSAANLDLILAMGFDACLVVPIRTEETIDGAITFVSAHPRMAYTSDEVSAAEHIARVAARALRSARIFADLNARQTAAELAEQQRLLALGRVTHELRTPLNAIGGYAELLTLGEHGTLTTAQERDVERIQWNQGHLLALVTEILSYVRADAWQVKFEIADIDLLQAGRDAATMLESELAKKQQRIAVAVPPAVVVARGDPARVRQVLVNLLTNANKYSPAATVVTVDCGRTAAVVFVDVGDAGPGVPAEDQESIFEPFVQLASGEEGRAGGIGLGLAIARELARGMKGDLTVRAGTAGGAVFRFTLPSAA